jgi:hypothetical protein
MYTENWSYSNTPDENNAIWAALAAGAPIPVRPPIDTWKGEVQIIFQTIEDLRAALPQNNGDWYFTGHYPTAGGFAVLNRSYINYFEKKDGRSY